MPAALMYSHKLVEKLADIRKHHSELMPYLRPDAKAQVTVAYDDNGKISGITTIVISTQHDSGVKQETIAADIKKFVVPAVIPADLIGPDTVFHINPTGIFEIGGPHGDTGLTGRKIIVDTYGGKAPHGGGAFSGKDPTKVDRSAAYAARYLAKNIVAAGLAEQCTIQVSYAIGVKEPVSLLVDTHGTGTIPSSELSAFIMRNIDLSPSGIIDRLQLKRPIYRATAAYGHFGRNDFPWEQLDLVPLFSTLSA
jgi:S-adenosylmethionine synthetase